jgi:hypothetical protein
MFAHVAKTNELLCWHPKKQNIKKSTTKKKQIQKQKTCPTPK